MKRIRAKIHKDKQILCINNNKIYYSLKEAGDDLKLSKSQIWRVLNGDLISTKGYKFVYINDPNIKLDIYWKYK